MRSVHTLYKIVLAEALIKGRDAGYGLCNLIQDVKFSSHNAITTDEEDKLLKYMKKLRPIRDRKHPFAKFAWNEEYHWDAENNQPWGVYWWNTNEEGKVQRHLFLKALIEYTTPWHIKIWRKVVNFKLFT